MSSLSQTTTLRLAALIAAGVLLLNLGPMGCGCDLHIQTNSLPDAIVGTFYEIELDSDCGGDEWFIAGGTLPPGLSLFDDGVLRGTPTVAGVFTVTIGVHDFGSGDDAFKGLSLTVHDAT